MSTSGGPITVGAWTTSPIEPFDQTKLMARHMLTVRGGMRDSFLVNYLNDPPIFSL